LDVVAALVVPYTSFFRLAAVSRGGSTVTRRQGHLMQYMFDEISQMYKISTLFGFFYLSQKFYLLNAIGM
jgi:hypothetical protein